MDDDLRMVQVLVAYVRVRLYHLRHDETGAMSLEWVGVIIGLLSIAAAVVLIVRAKARAGANRITIP